MLTYAFLSVVYYLAVGRGTLQRLQHPVVQSLLGATVCALTLLWQVNAQLPGWPVIHFLGLTCAVLVLGFRLGLLALAIPLALELLFHYWHSGTIPSDLSALSLRWSLLVVAASVSYGLYLLCDRYLPHHFFTVIFAGSFLNAMATASLYYTLNFMVMETTLPLSSADWFLLPLIALPEALLNGMAMTLLVVYRPHWVAVLRMGIFDR